MKSKDALFQYKNKTYPEYIRNGNAASFIIPFAKNFCSGKGLDIGGYLDWTFPGSFAINITNDDKWDAYNIPNEKYDYIFSSHTLEHLPNYVKALRYWKDHLKNDGILFLYLPHPDMEYWLPQNNEKHLHSFIPNDLKKVLCDIGFKEVLISERDLYWSFTLVAFNS